MKTSLEVMNMKRNSIVITRSILSIAHKLLGRIFIIIHKNTQIFVKLIKKSSYASREM